MPDAPWHENNPRDCAMLVTLNVIGGKWKPAVLHLLVYRPMRFSEMRRAIPEISQKVLTQRLRELEQDDIVHREVFPEVPPRVEYSLTPRGQTLVPILQSLFAWGEANR
ncbi:MAG: winged helix-turn-helix transcriptional regulator [Nannocystales bacterium]